MIVNADERLAELGLVLPEIPATSFEMTRTVWAEDPNNLASPLHYDVTVVDGFAALLRIFVDASHHHGSAIGVEQWHDGSKAFFPIFEIDRVDDRFALAMLQGQFEQLLNARFQTESPATLNTRNYRTFAAANQSIAQNARLMAMLWTALNLATWREAFRC